MKALQVYVLMLMTVFCIACGGKNKTDPVIFIKSNIVDTVTPYGPNTMVRNVKKGSNGNILFAASFAGVFRYDGKLFTNIASKIGSRRYWDVLEDRKGNYWFATTDSGVYCYNGNYYQHFDTKQGLASNAVFCIYEDKAGAIWFGTGGGISRYDGNTFQNLTTKDGLSNNGIHTILEDKTGKMWFGTAGDACFYDGEKFTVFRNKDGKAFYNVWSIIEDHKGNIWLGGSIIEDKRGDTLLVSAGLWRYDGRNYIKVSKRGATAIIEDKKGNIWTTGSVKPPNGKVWALSRYDQKSLYNQHPTVTEITLINGPGMLCGLVEASDGSIWYGALGATSGVFRYNAHPNGQGNTITDFKNATDQQ
ncbi:MAG: two-component regulator propeller domain-containing protein [Pelobium sp.]